jgi:Rab-like protein 3
MECFHKFLFVTILFFPSSLSLFSDITLTSSTGVIFIHDLTQRKTKSNLSKWAAEIASAGTFSAPLGSGGPGGLPVPYLVIANKADIVPREGTRVSSGNLVDVARQWVEKQGLLPSSSSEELPLTESFPGSSGLLAVSCKLSSINLSSCYVTI